LHTTKSRENDSNITIPENVAE
jgi:hypothetical protein